MTCHDRLTSLGLSVGLLSRFKSKAQQTQIIKDLFNRKIDVLVGTHRILSKDIVLTNLGLLIVDEEHRFGVEDKETIRRIREGVDVLTLTATPIPRTLQQSLVGLKDVSIKTSTPSRILLIVSLSYTPKRCSSSTIKRPRLVRTISFDSILCVPTKTSMFLLKRSFIICVC